MNKKHWKLITDIVDDLLQTEQTHRQQEILEERCGNNKELQKEVVNLLESIENSSDYWDSLFQSNRLFIGDLTQNHNVSSEGDEYLKAAPLPEISSEIPSQIGFYSINKRIGYGGMGEVLLASRIDEKFNQNVALKLMRRGVSSQDQAHRFEQERAILSSLNHPNIARLMDGGISGDGRSYYVMEYVDGIPITTYCEKHDCSLSQRLDLFKQVCKAVQYAHSNFIVHRDLKPDNLLVNKEGVVKILDFGIAKMIDDSLDEQALLQTSSGLRMLSLKYAAPEQITLEPITIATDVYSLGVLLYELLTGSYPLPLKNKGVKEAEYIIRNHEPARPSSISNSLKEKLKGDLDAIILKALRKEADERYKSAQNMLEDIERYKNSLPVSARQDSLSYRTKKFVRRHSIPLFFSAFILILIVGFTFFYTYRISQEKRLAELQAQKAEQITLFLMDMFEANSPAQTGGEILSVRDMLVRGENEAEKLEGYPELKAQMFEVIGEVYRRLGLYEKSESLLEQSLSIRQNLYGNIHPETAGILDKLGLLLINKGDFYKADSLLSFVLNIREQHFNSPEPILANTLSNLAFVTRRSGNYDEAETFYRRSLELRKKHLGENHPLTVENMSSLGVLLHNNANYKEAEQLYRQILEQRQKLLSPIHPDVAISQNSLGSLLMNLGNYQEADSLLNVALSVRKKLYGEEHPFVALTLNNIGISKTDQNQLEGAANYLNEAHRIRLEQLGENHTNTAISKFSIANLMLKTNQPDSALTLFKEALLVFQENLIEHHSFTARTEVGIGSAYLAKKDMENAKVYFERGYPKVQKIHPKASLEHALSSIQYASFLMKTDNEERANTILESAYEALQTLEYKESERQRTVLALLNELEEETTL